MIVYIFLCISCLILLLFLKLHGQFEPFENETWRRIDQTNPSEYIWNTILSIDVENMRPYNIRSHKAGVSVSDLQKAIKVSEVAGFPSENILNSDYNWMSYRPRFIPKAVYDKCITDFLKNTNIKNRFNLTLLKARIIHANVTKNEKHFLLTFQLIMNQPSVMYAKVIEFTVLYTWDTKKTQYTNARVIGLIHESFLIGYVPLHFPMMATVDA